MILPRGLRLAAPALAVALLSCTTDTGPGPLDLTVADRTADVPRHDLAADGAAREAPSAREAPPLALPEQPGPFPVGTLEDSYTSGSWGTYALTLYYPATAAGANAPFDPKGAPYPAVVFAHGYLGNKSANTWVGKQLASHGYLCLLLGVPTPNTPNVAQWTDGITGAIDYLVARSAPGGKLAGLLDSARIGAAGHSMGANGTILAAAKDGRIKAAVPLAYCSAPFAAAIKVPVQIHSASLDGVCAPALSTALYGALAAPKQLLEIAGGNHIGWLDAGLAYQAAQVLIAQGLLTDKPATISRDEQERLSRRYLTSWFGAYLKGDSSYLPFLFGAQAADDRATGKLSLLQSAQ